jgi:nicotinamide-nucleotide amidase
MPTFDRGEDLAKRPGLEVSIGQSLRELSATLATAESCTGGLLGAFITSVPGSSDYYLGGVISYANPVKEKLLGVSQSTLINHGAVSQVCVEEMAHGVRILLGSTYGVAISGIAGPAGETPGKPVGTVHFAVDSPAGCVAGQILHPGSREEVRRVAAEAALLLLRQVLDNVVQGISPR